MSPPQNAVPETPRLSHASVIAPLSPLTEEQLLKLWGGCSEPLVSIICPTFNHARYVRDALDGFLGQVTDFPFEIIVRDDASTDSTVATIQQYVERYPRIVRCIHERENTFSRGVSMFPPLMRAARGTFVAICAGDDYWTDSTKLRRQVAQLRERPDASVCFHDTVAVRESKVLDGWGFPTNLPELIVPAELCVPRGWFPMPATWLFRRSACDFEACEFDKIVNEDILLLTQFARSGPAVRIPGKLAVYRIHETSVYSSKSERQQRLVRLNTFLWVSRYQFRTGSHEYGRKCALAAAFGAADELKGFGRQVLLWTTLMYFRVLLLGLVDPGSLWRKRIGELAARVALGRRQFLK
jgi:glycosyltransferase involved in cell wall biosynthesis